jgi:glycosyltransferase involved in cell wall biosynthesis
MKVLFTTEYYSPFTPGGSPWSIRLLAEALAARGHAVTVVTPNYGAASREVIGGVSIVRFPFWRRLAPGPFLATTRDLVSLRFHWRLFRAAAGEARRWGADVIHAQDKHALVGSFFAARVVRRPVFLTLRDTGLICPIATCLLSHEFVPADCSPTKLQRECAGFYLDNYIGGGRLRRARIRANLALLYADARLKRALLMRLDGLVSVSRGLLEIYLRSGRGRRERSHVVYSLPPEPRTADPDAVRSVRIRHGLEGRDVVLYVGKLSPGKGGRVFLQAAERVAAERPGTVFLVAGPDRPRPAAQTAEIRWLGRLSHEELLSVYAAVEMVVLPSVGPEALSRVPLEAAMAARPTIGARAGGIPEEILDGETGLLVDRNDPEALAQGMLRLLENRELREQLGQKARCFVMKKFDPDAIVESLVGLYKAARV